MFQRTLLLIIVLTCCHDLHAQSVNRSQKVVAPPGNIITADWLKSRPHNSKVMAIVPADFSSPPRLLLTGSAYLNEYCQHGSPSWSRDGSVIVVEVMKDVPWRQGIDESQIVSVKPDGTGPRSLGFGSMPDISPDGRRIAYMKMNDRPRTVHTMKIDGTDRKPLPNIMFSEGCQWSPDGTSIVLMGESGSLDRFDLKLEKSFELYPATPLDHYWEFAWTPDASKIVILLNRTESKVPGEYVVFISMIDLSSKPPKQIDFPETFLSVPFVTVSPDGERIVYAQDGVLLEIEIAKPDSFPRPVKGQFTDFSYGNAAYSHDGKWIAVAIN